VAYLTLNRPHVLNAISYEMMQLLEEFVLNLSCSEDISTITIKGAGRSFCVGADLRFFLNNLDNLEELERYIEQINKAFNSLQECPQAVVAVVQDYALAGGFELLQACDIIIAAENARLGDQHANYWLIPGGGGTQRLAYSLGIHRTKDLLFTGRWISGEEAAKIGLISRAVPSEDLESQAETLVMTISEKSPAAIKKMKKLVNSIFGANLKRGLIYEKSIFLEHIQSPSSVEGLKAFVEKRKPQLSNIGH
jgi:enoyl-CoA hydratase/carnithine racemase